MQAQPAAKPAPMPFEFDLRHFFGVIFRRLPVIFAIVFLITAVAVAMVMTATRMYTTTARVLIDTRQTQLVDVESVLSGVQLDTNVVDTEVKIIASPALAMRVIEEHNLIEDPEFNGTLKEPGFNLREWVKGLLGMAEEKPQPTEAEIVEGILASFQDRTVVRRDGFSYVIDVSFTSESPAKAARLANAIADAYLVDQLEAKFDATNRAREWLRTRVDDLAEQVYQAENAVETFRAQNDLVVVENVEGTLLNDVSLTGLNTQLINARVDLGEKEARLNSVRRMAARGDNLEGLTDALDSATITALRTQQAAIIRQQADLLTRYGDRHPQVLKVNKELDDIEQQIRNEVQRTVSSVEQQVNVSRERVRTLERQLAELEDRSKEGRKSLVQLRQLEREAEAVRSLYESFLNRFKETTETASYQQADGRVLARARVPKDPSSPKSRLIVLAAFAASSIMGVAAAFLLELVSSERIRGVDDVEQFLGLSVLASVPRLTSRQLRTSRGMAEPHDVLLQAPTWGFTDAYRSLRAAVTLSNNQQLPKTVMFTSSMPEEGKTTSAICYARSLARTGVRTLLLDLDLRESNMRGRLKLSTDAGLVEVLIGEAPLGQAAVQDRVKNLDILPIVKRPQNPQDVITSKTFESLLDELQYHYDAIVIDSPPVLVAADTRLLVKYAEKIIFIVQANKTQKNAARSAIRELTQVKGDIPGVLLTQVEKANLKYGVDE